MKKRKLSEKRRRALYEAHRRFWTVFITIAMVMQSTPIQLYGEVITEDPYTEEEGVVSDGENRTDARTSFEAEEADSQAPPSGDEAATAEDLIAIPVDVQHATITSGDQSLTNDTGSLEVSRSVAFVFQVQPEDGYELDGQSVTATIGEDQRVLEGDGTFTLDAADLEAGASLSIVATKIPMERTYTYSDDAVSVTAELDDATAIPEDATLRVTQITRELSEQSDGLYSYAAYMEALNKSAGATDEPAYTEQNTLLYDVAFIHTDADGNDVELQPASGAVTLKFNFNANQLSEQIGVKDAADVVAVHLPIANKAQEATTAQSTGIAADDVNVEAIAPNDFSTDGIGTLELKAQSFSAYAIANLPSKAQDEEEGNETAEGQAEQEIEVDEIEGEATKNEKDLLSVQADVSDYAVTLNVNPAGLNVSSGDKYWVFLRGKSDAGGDYDVYYLSSLGVSGDQSTVTIPVAQNGTSQWKNEDGNTTTAEPAAGTVEGYIIKSENTVLTVTQARGRNNCEWISAGGNVKNYGVDSITPGANGMTYTVEEQGTAGITTYVGTVSASTQTNKATGALSNTQQSKADFINKRYVGGFDLSKVLVSDLAADADAEFTFTITLSDTTISGSEGASGAYGATFTNGVAQVTLKNGEKAEIRNLPEGVEYSIEETTTGYAISRTVDGNSVTTVEELAIDSTKTPNIVFTNSRTPGGLKATKNVVTKQEASDAEKNRDFYFRVTLYNDAEHEQRATNITKAYPKLDAQGNPTEETVGFEQGVTSFTLKGGESLSIGGLPSGIYYTVEEWTNSTYQTVGAPQGWVLTSAGGTGQIEENSLKTEVFTNTKDEGTLNVIKTVESSDDNDKKKDFRFVVTLDNENVNGDYGTIYDEAGKPVDDGTVTFTNGVAVFTLKHGWHMTASGLPNNVRYQVVEQREDGTDYTSEGFTTSATDDDGQISNGNSKTAAFTNTKAPGPITISKKVVSPIPAEKTAKYTFNIQLVYATAADGHEAGDPAGVNGTYAGVQFTNGTATVEVIGDSERTITGLPTGVTYKVTEVAVTNMTTTATVDGATVEAEGGELIATGTITTSGSKVEFTNTHQPSSIIINKQVVSDVPADEQQEFNFTIELNDNTVSGEFDATRTTGAGDGAATENTKVTFTNGKATITLRHDQSLQINGLPKGTTYTVTEEEDVLFELQKTGDTGALGDDPLTAAFTNTRKKGDLELKKTVKSSTDADRSKDFEFAVTLAGDKGTTVAITKEYAATKTAAGGTESDVKVNFADGVATTTLKHDETLLIKGLPFGINYTVSEKTEEGFKATYSGEAGVISSQVATAHVTNTKDEGGLIVYKKVVSDVPGDKLEAKTFHFIVTLLTGEGATDTSVNQSYGDMTFQNGVAEFDLADGNSATATGLPKGTKYRVEETLTQADGQLFTTSWEGLTNGRGQISDETAEVTATNTRNKGDVEITKKVLSNQVADNTREFDFTMTLSDTSITGLFGDLSFANGVATFKLTKDETKTAKGLPEGIGYQITEATPAGYVLVTSDNVEANVTKSAQKVTFTNKRTYTGVSIKKEWNDNNNQDGFRPDSVTVELLANDTPVSTVRLTKEGADKDESTVEDNWYAELAPLPTHTDDGTPITYTWREVAVDKYQVTSAQSDATFTFTIDEEELEAQGYKTTLTNNHEPVSTLAEVEKVWNDADDNDGKRPESLQVTLKANDTVVTKDKDGNDITNPVTLDASNNWHARIDNLPKYANGQEITYKWEETALPEGYILSESDMAVVTYTVDEQEITGYKTTLINSYDVEFTTASVKKVWNDRDNRAGFRPQYLDVQLMADGVAAKDSAGNDIWVELSEPTWSATVSQLPANKNGQKIVYSWNEAEVPAHYTLGGTVTSGTLTTITNNEVEEYVYARIEKVWDDNNDQDGVRPPFLTVRLLRNGQSMNPDQVYVLNTGNGWFYNTGKTLDKYIGGALAEYTWEEVDLPADYEIKGSQILWKDDAQQTIEDHDSAESIENLAGTWTTYTNGKEPRKAKAKVTKVWNDENNKSNKRANFDVTLKANGDTVKWIAGMKLDGAVIDDSLVGQDIKLTLTEDNGWTAEVEGLPYFAAGKRIAYTWEEAVPAGYRLTSNVTEDQKDGETITTLTNDLNVGDLTVSKKLISQVAADADQIFTFTVTLNDTTINGTFGDMTFTDGKATVTLTGGQSATAEGLPQDIGYAITEAAAEGFSITGNNATGTIRKTPTTVEIKNERIPGELDVKKMVVSNTAADKNKDFYFRVTLGGLDTSKTSYTYNGTTFEQSGTNYVATFALKHDQTKSFDELPGSISYTVEELVSNEDSATTGAPAGWVLTKTGDTGTIGEQKATAHFTNNRLQGGLTLSKELISDFAADANQEFEFTVTLGDTSISGTYGQGSSAMTFQNGVATVTLKGGQRAEATDLPQGITYTITEASATGFELKGITVDSEEKTAATGTISETGSSVVFTNKRTTGGFDVKKIVSSNTAADENKDFYFRVTLSDTSINGANSKETDNNGNPLPYGDGISFANGVAEFSLKHDQTKEINNLPTDVRYVVEELVSGGEDARVGAPTGWTLVKEGTTGTVTKNTRGLATFTNTRNEGDLKVVKVVQSDVADDVNKEFTVNVKLDKLDGKSVSGTYGDMSFDEQGVATFTLKTDSDENSSKTATNLPAGLGYTVEEVLEGNDTNLYTVTYSGKTGTVPRKVAGTIATATITNERAKGNLKLSKELVLAPTVNSSTRNFEFTIQLNTTFAEEKTFSGVTFGTDGKATVSLAGNESKTIEGLPAGIGYTITEANAPGYTLAGKTGDSGTISTSETESKFTNTREYVNVKVKKVWNDAENQDGKRPPYINVKLTAAADGQTSDFMTLTLSLRNNWEQEILNLPKYDDNGNEITYAWTEVVQTDVYDLVALGYNAARAGQPQVSVENWLKDGAVYGKVTTLTNDYVPEEVKAKVLKVWNDQNNNDRKRPSQLRVYLYADGQPVKDAADLPVSVLLTNGNDETSPQWTAGEISGLPKYNNGKLISYTWVEDLSWQDGRPDVDKYTITT